MKPKSKTHGTKRLKPNCVVLLSSSAFNLNVRRYFTGAEAGLPGAMYDLGRSVQVDPMIPLSKAPGPGTIHLKLRYDEPVSNVAYIFVLCCYTSGAVSTRGRAWRRRITRRQQAGIGARQTRAMGKRVVSSQTCTLSAVVGPRRSYYRGLHIILQFLVQYITIMSSH